MSMFRQRRNEVPELNVASLPDLIFTVLFFFMIVTHMRNVSPQVKVEQPKGTSLANFNKQNMTIYLFVGSQDTVVQVNNSMVPVSKLAETLEELCSDLSGDERQQVNVSLNADRQVSMKTISEVKQALRKVNVRHICYVAKEHSKLD